MVDVHVQLLVVGGVSAEELADARSWLLSGGRVGRSGDFSCMKCSSLCTICRCWQMAHVHVLCWWWWSIGLLACAGVGF
jgi:hypothetical protein